MHTPLRRVAGATASERKESASSGQQVSSCPNGKVSVVGNLGVNLKDLYLYNRCDPPVWETLAVVIGPTTQFVPLGLHMKTGFRLRVKSL